MKALFELDLAGGFAARAARQVYADPGVEIPWDTLNAGDYAPDLAERGRIGWTENAFNEYCTASAMAQLVQVLLAAQAPIDLVTLASGFVVEELVHVELCARVATRLGGGAPIAYDPEHLTFPFDPSLTPLQRANELVVRLCCIGEEFSLPMLAGSMRAAGHPVTRAVLERIVAGEALHGRLGWLYLEWVGPALDDAERARLAGCAHAAARHLAPIWERMRSAPRADAIEAAGRSAMGWMEPEVYLSASQEAMGVAFAKLRGHGIPA